MWPVRSVLGTPASVVGEEWTDELLERLAVAGRDDTRRDRRHSCGPRNPHRRRDLTEVVAGPQHPARAQRVLDREHPGEDDIEAVALLAFAHDDRPRRDLLALHSLAEPHERLARQPREQPNALQLVLGCATPRHRRRGRPAALPTDSASTP